MNSNSKVLRQQKMSQSCFRHKGPSMVLRYFHDRESLKTQKILHRFSKGKSLSGGLLNTKYPPEASCFLRRSRSLPNTRIQLEWSTKQNRTSRGFPYSEEVLKIQNTLPRSFKYRRPQHFYQTQQTLQKTLQIQNTLLRSRIH